MVPDEFPSGDQHQLPVICGEPVGPFQPISPGYPPLEISSVALSHWVVGDLLNSRHTTKEPEWHWLESTPPTGISQMISDESIFGLLGPTVFSRWTLRGEPHSFFQSLFQTASKLSIDVAKMHRMKELLQCGHHTVSWFLNYKMKIMGPV